RSTFGIQRSANKHSGTSANTRMFTSWRSTFGIQRSANKHSGTSANTRMFTGRKPTADCRKPLLRPDHRIRVRCLHGFDEARISVGLPAFTRNVDPAASGRVFAIVLF